MAGEKAYVAAQRARGAGNHLAWYAKEHPIRIAVTLGVIAWCMMRCRSTPAYLGASDPSWDQDEYGSTEPGLRDKVGAMASTARETVGEYASTAKQAVGQYASSARETVGEYANSARDTVNDYAASAASTAKVAAQRARSAAGTATTATNDWVQENPLAAGALAVAVGAAIGLACPATDYGSRHGRDARSGAGEGEERCQQHQGECGRQGRRVCRDVVGESLRNAAAEPPMGQA